MCIKPTSLTKPILFFCRFAHVINVEFFDDILKVLERLLNEGNLKPRQILLCISTVLAVLDGQGSALTLDPTSFHKHLYRALINLRCGKLSLFIVCYLLSSCAGILFKIVIFQQENQKRMLALHSAA